MAFNGAKIASAAIKRAGQSVVISWPARGLDATAGTTTVRTFARVFSKGAKLPPSSFGSMTGLSPMRNMVAMLPLQKLDLTGASLTVDKTTYVVASWTIEDGSYIMAVLQ